MLSYLRRIEMKNLQPSLGTELDFFRRSPWEAVLLLCARLVITKISSSVSYQSAKVPRRIVWLRPDRKRPSEQNQDCMYGVNRVDRANNVSGEEMLVRFSHLWEHRCVLRVISAGHKGNCPEKKVGSLLEVTQRSRCVEDNAVRTVMLMKAIQISAQRFREDRCDQYCSNNSTRAIPLSWISPSRCSPMAEALFLEFSIP